jgi:branched-chain amino acid transport system permease protein
MDFGTKLAEGLPKEIQENPAVLEAYLGGIDDDLDLDQVNEPASAGAAL